MTPLLLGQLLGVAFACGLNLYATIVTVGAASRFGLVELPPGLRGLESGIVLATALALLLVEAVIDRIAHVDSVWDTVHTFIRPPAAALLAVGATWGAPVELVAGAAALSFLVALGAHGAKAGLRLALNTTPRDASHTWISSVEDLTAVTFAFAAFRFPIAALAGAGVVLLPMTYFGPRLWRASALGMRCVSAFFRALFTPPGWHDAEKLPRRLHDLLDDPPLGSAAPRGTRAAVRGLPDVGEFRNGWLVATSSGPLFLYRAWLRYHRVDLPPARSVESVPGLWATTLEVTADRSSYTLYLLKDGPAVDLAIPELGTMAT